MMDGSYGVADPWVYYLRNCTSYVAWKINQGFNKNISGWGNAASWNTNALNAGYTDDSTPQAGDIAQYNGTVSNPWGHVAYVYGVNGSGYAELDEYNAAGTGLFSNNRTTAPSSAGAPSHFIHIGTPPPPPPPTLPAHHDLAWYDGTNLYGFQAPTYVTATTASGYSTPGWAGAGQYGSDSKEGIFWYDPGTTTIYYIHSGFTGAQVVRGPGVGAPVWAGVGNFTGDGKRDSIAWYDGTNLYLFTGTGLTTSATISGYSTPAWAGVGDYNQDNRDDLFWYLSSSSTIYELTSTGSTFDGAVSVRGPGVGAPIWAGVGDFDGNHYRNDLAWYDGTNLFTFEGGALVTTGDVTGYSTPTWAGVGDANGDGKDDLFWYIGGTNQTIYCIESNGSSFPGAVTIRSGIGPPTWADTGNFY
jgi:hypothetical protein